MMLSVIQNLFLDIPIEALGDEKLITNRTIVVFLVGFFVLAVFVFMMYRSWKKDMDKKRGNKD